MAEPLRVYTDGACSGNPGPGGWGWASSRDHYGSGADPSTTNNKMELMAVLKAIEANPGPLVVVMDSTYVKDGLEKWSKNWVRNGWQTKDKKPVKNREIWEPLVALRDKRGSELSFEWVKGHSGHPLNDFVDELAVAQRDKARGAEKGSGSAGTKLADMDPAQQREERRKRDSRIPDGHLLVVVGMAEVTSDSVLRKLRDLIAGYRDIYEDLVVVTGLRPGAEQLGAKAAIAADVPYVALVSFPGQERNFAPEVKAQYLDLVDRASSVVNFERKVPTNKDEFVKAMRRRDSWLVNAADQGVLVWDESDNRFDRLFSDLDKRLGAELTVFHP